MNQLVSDFGSLNFRERIKLLLIAVGGALLSFVWGAINPVVDNLITNHVFDLSLFTSVVNWGTILTTALTAGASYLGITLPTGKSGIPFNRK